MTPREALNQIIITLFNEPKLWTPVKIDVSTTSTRPGVPWSGFKPLVHAIIECHLAPPQPFAPQPGWKLFRVIGTGEYRARSPIRACYQTAYALRRGAFDFANPTPDSWQSYDPLSFVKKIVEQGDSADITDSLLGPAPGYGEFAVTPSILPAPTCDAPGDGIAARTNNYLLILQMRDNRWSNPTLELFQRRRPRKFGRSALALWLKQHDQLSLGRKFARQRDKLVAHPNDKGFGQAGTATWKDKIRDAAKRVAVDAAKDAVKSATKGIADKAAKKAGATIKKRAESALKEIIRKR